MVEDHLGYSAVRGHTVGPVEGGNGGGNRAVTRRNRAVSYIWYYNQLPNPASDLKKRTSMLGGAMKTYLGRSEEPFTALTP